MRSEMIKELELRFQQFHQRFAIDVAPLNSTITMHSTVPLPLESNYDWHRLRSQRRLSRIVHAVQKVLEPWVRAQIVEVRKNFGVDHPC